MCPCACQGAIADLQALLRVDPNHAEFDVAWELREARRQLANQKVGKQTC